MLKINKTALKNSKTAKTALKSQKRQNGGDELPFF
jgi:hypothetical protein